MDFVTRLINEGYGEEDIGDVLESLYIIEKNGSGNILKEELITEDTEYLVENIIVRMLTRLRSLPKTPAVQKQIKRLERLLRGGKDKVDDVASKADDVADDIAKKGDDLARTGQKTGDVIDASKPPTSSSRRPTNQPAGGRRAGETPSGKPAPKPTRAQTQPTRNTTPTKTPGKGKGNIAKTAGLATLGALGYNYVTTGSLNPFAPPKDSSSNGSDSDTSGQNQNPGDNTPTNPEKDKPKSTAEKHGIPAAPFWWSSVKPKTLPYQKDPGRSSYLNVRRNEAYEIVLNHLIESGHAETIEEANYVMEQMEFDHFVEIIESYSK